MKSFFKFWKTADTTNKQRAESKVHTVTITNKSGYIVRVDEIVEVSNVYDDGYGVMVGIEQKGLNEIKFLDCDFFETEKVALETLISRLESKKHLLNLEYNEKRRLHDKTVRKLNRFKKMFDELKS